MSDTPAEHIAALAYAEKMHGPFFTYTLEPGTEVNLYDLKIGQRVCASQVDGYHILMTPKEPVSKTGGDILNELLSHINSEMAFTHEKQKTVSVDSKEYYGYEVQRGTLKDVFDTAMQMIKKNTK